MNDMRNLRNLDLNLLVIFDAVYRERHVTRAADRLNMSQPAVSNALQRLRHSLRDELFVKTQQGIEPSERAHGLATPIRAILKELGEVLAHQSFDPATTDGEITIAAVDYVDIALLPELVTVISQKAPGVRLRMIPTHGRSYDLLDRGEADIALASYGTVPSRFRKETLKRETYVCVMRAEHPAAQGPFDAHDYAAFDHVLQSPKGDLRGSTDAALEAQGLKRQVKVSLSSFAHAPDILAATDMVLTAPRSVAEALCTDQRLAMRPCPVAVDEAAQRLDMLWHNRLGARPLAEWMRQELRAICL